MFKRKLACSFCRRSEAEVAKLVAGPRVYICDRCAAEAIRIMDTSGGDASRPLPAARRGLIAAVRFRVQSLWHRHVRRRAAQSLASFL
jgi:hypothetical protein